MTKFNYNLAKTDTSNFSILAIVKPTQQSYHNKKNNQKLLNYVVDYIAIPTNIIDNFLFEHQPNIIKLGYSLLNNNIDSAKFNIILKKDRDSYKRLLQSDLAKSTRFRIHSEYTLIDTNLIFQLYDLTDLLNTDLVYNKNNLNSFFSKEVGSHIFIFRNIEWTTVTLFFRKVGILLSGGKASSRSYLSKNRLILSLVFYSFLRVFRYKGNLEIDSRVAKLNRNGVFNPFYTKYYRRYFESVLNYNYNLKLDISDEELNVNILKTLFNDSINKGMINLGFSPYFLVSKLVETAKSYYSKDTELQKPSNEFLGHNIFKVIYDQLQKLDNAVYELLQILKDIKEIKPKDEEELTKLTQLSIYGEEALSLIKESNNKKYKSIGKFRHYFDNEFNRIISVHAKDNLLNSNTDVNEKNSSLTNNNNTNTSIENNSVENKNQSNNKNLNQNSKRPNKNNLTGNHRRSYFTSAVLNNDSNLGKEFKNENKSLNNNLVSKNGNLIKSDNNLSNNIETSNKKSKFLEKIIQQNKSLSFLDTVEMFLKEPLNASEATEVQMMIEKGWEQKVSQDLNDTKNNIIKTGPNCMASAYENFKIWCQNPVLKRHFPTLYEDISKIESIAIAYSLVVTYFSKYSYTNIVSKIGTEILRNIYKTRAKNAKLNYCIKNNLALDLDIDINLYFMSYENFLLEHNVADKDKLVRLGTWVFNSFENKGIFIKEYKHSESEIATINVDPLYIGNIIDNLVILPNSLPMIVKPLKWAENKYGGYLLNKEEKEGLITGSTSYHKHTITNKEKLFKAINYLNSIKFEINKDLLNYLKKDGEYLIKNFNLDNKGNIDPSKTLNTEITLKIASVYSNTPFYLNTHADWRGRIYTQSHYLSYQGSDLANALLQFNKGQVLNETGKYYLYIYGANLYDENNLSKSSYSDRINWINLNKQRILNMDPDFILKSKSVFLFASFCLVMKQLENNPKVKIKLPVFLDATCSGIQHVAALIKDFELGQRVNLIAQKDTDPVKDIYSEIMDPINKEINDYGLKNIEYVKLAFVKFDRSILKVSIMTKVYNVTIHGIADQLANKLVSEYDKNAKIMYYKAPTQKPDFYMNLTRRDLMKIADIIHNKVFVLFPSLRKVYDYFIAISKLLIKLNVPLSWFTPSGLLITQHYIKAQKSKISISLGGNTKTMVLKKYIDVKDSMKQSQAIIPNVIHSLDASHLINLINKIKDNYNFPFICVHDCFGTLPNDMDLLNNLVKLEFILLYTEENYLNKFHNKILESIKDNNFEIIDNKVISKNFNEKFEIPELPELGNLDLKAIEKSKYMIC